MPRINPSSHPDSKSLKLLDDVKQLLGGTPNIFTTLAHSSAALEFALGGIRSVANSKISPALREQISLTVAGTNSCDYCASAHTAIGKTHKISDTELTQNILGKSSDSKTQSVLSFVHKLMNSKGKVADADIAILRGIGFGDGEILEIIAIVTLNIFTNYVNNVASTTIDFPLVHTAKPTEKM